MIKKIASKILGVFQVLADGFATVRQMGDFTANPWIKGTAGCSSLVEGAIYEKYINQGLGLFSLLNKKELLKYLVIQAFEAELIRIEDLEKKFIEQISVFFSDAKKDREKNQDTEGLNWLEKIDLFKKVEYSGINEKQVDRAFEIFTELCKERNGKKEFVDFNINTKSERFKALQALFAEIRKANMGDLSVRYKAMLANFKNAKSKDVDNENQRKLKEELKILQNILVVWVNDAQNGLPISEKYINPDLLKKMQEVASEVNKKLWALRLSMLFSGIAGIASGVVTFYTFPSVFLSLGLFIAMPQLLIVIVCLLTILTVISYAIIIYSTAANLILHEKLSKWWKDLSEKIGEEPHTLKYIILVVTKTLSHIVKNTINWLRKNSDETIFSYFIRIILVLSILIFTGMASVTVAYTIFTLLAPYINVTICILVALIVSSSDLLFTIKNSFNSIILLHGLSLNNLIYSIKKRLNNLQAQSQQENYLQVGLNLIRLPLEILHKVFISAILLLHVTSSAVATDKFPGCANWVGFFINLIMEYLTDFAAVFGKKEVGNDHDHDHDGIINFIAKIIFFAPVTLLGISNFFLSQLNRLSSNQQLKVLGFVEAIKMEWYKFDIQHLHVNERNDYQQQDNNLVEKDKGISNLIDIYTCKQVCFQQVKRLEKTAFAKKPTLVNLKSNIFRTWAEKFESIGQEISKNAVHEEQIPHSIEKNSDLDATISELIVKIKEDTPTLKMHRYPGLFKNSNREATQSDEAATKLQNCLSRVQLQIRCRA